MREQGPRDRGETDDRDRDLRDVVEQESSRGRRRGAPSDPDVRRERARLMRNYERAFRKGATEREFANAIRDLGLKDGTPPFVAALSLWRRTR